MHQDQSSHAHGAHPHHRFTLRDLPLPARLTLTVFLIAVGLGYVSAMVQLHFKEATPGEPLPTPADVVAHYSGSEWPIPDRNAPPEAKDEPGKEEVSNEPKVAGIKIKSLIEARCGICHAEGQEQADNPLTNYDGIAKFFKPSAADGKLHKLVTGPETAWDKNISMVPAFFKKSEEWKEVIGKRAEVEVRAERETERAGLAAWLEAGAPESCYKADSFPLPVALRLKPLTQEFKIEAAPMKEGAKPAPPKKRSAKSRQTSIEGLTQSTHAHLLSFAVLWTCTGLCFAFTSYPWWVRIAFAPTVLLAQVVDISFWWLSRIGGVGPYFALGIFATGGIVGVGLLVQIVGSVFDMHRGKARAYLLGIFVLLAAAGAVGFIAVVKPQLDAEKAAN